MLSSECIPLWPAGETPGALGTGEAHEPTLSVTLPYGETFLGSAMLILQGGAYRMLATHEGPGYAALFSSYGFTSFVLRYRLSPDGYRHPNMLQDATRAMRWIRANAAKYGVRPNKICVVGSSAGGHLAATLLTKWDKGNPRARDPIERKSSRPDAGILCYPVITMLEKANVGSRENLLGKNFSRKLAESLSAERHVNAQTPPCFLWHTVEDGAVPVENSLDFAAALRAAGVPFEMHIYEKGRHGLGLKDGRSWTKDCLEWLKLRFAAKK